jgi:glycosyltransferase involved in cell wall biosynthesis
MNIAFYAPMKSPKHPTPSGDRTMARQVMRALVLGGHAPHLSSELRSYCAAPGARALRTLTIKARWERRKIFNAITSGARPKPDAWVTYHSYYKAPDLLGPSLSRALRIPYFIVEPSYAPQRASGPWAAHSRAAAKSIVSAHTLFVMKSKDRGPLATLVDHPDRLASLEPFIDRQPNAQGTKRATAQPIILTAAMMRPGAKMESYAVLIAALQKISNLNWTAVFVGDGEMRRQLTERCDDVLPGRVTFTGALDKESIAAWYDAADILAWPGIDEAYGMSYLEAAAHGAPSVAMDGPGVRHVILHGKTGLLSQSKEDYADKLGMLLTNRSMRRRLGDAAGKFATGARSISKAAAQLDLHLQASLGARL